MSEVRLISFKTIPYNSPAELLQREVESIIASWPLRGEPLAIKVHFGEKGSTRFVRPLYIGGIVESVKKMGAIPFCTDTNVLYRGLRAIAPTHLEVAYKHGFNYATINCPVIIADGILGRDAVPVKCDGKYLDRVPVASAIADAPFLIVVTHVTFHGFSGLGSTVKNLGMGCLAVEGKKQIHSSTVPKIFEERCNSCGACLQRCRFGAISLNPAVVLDRDRCTGCCHCIGVCLNNVFEICDDQYLEFCEKLVDASLAVIRGKKTLFINFLSEITRQCDCASFTHPPVCRDLGILISERLYDVEAATYDLLNQETGFAKGDPRPEFIIRQILEKGRYQNTKYMISEVIQ